MSKHAAHGISAELPSGWSGLIYRRRDDDSVTGKAAEEVPESGAIFHAATVPLEQNDADFGSSVVRRLGSIDTLIVLMEYAVDENLRPGEGLFEERGVPWPLDARDFSSRSLQVTVEGQAGVQRFFTIEDRPFCLYVVLGSRRALRQLDRINSVLDSLEIEPGEQAAA